MPWRGGALIPLSEGGWVPVAPSAVPHAEHEPPPAALDDAAATFTVSLIPETLARTTLGFKQPGDPVNLEADIIAKHVEKLLQAGLVPGRTEESA